MTRLHILVLLNLGGLSLTQAAPPLVLPCLFVLFAVDAVLQMHEKRQV